MDYNEADTRAKLIDPALSKAGWKDAQIRREVNFTAGRIYVQGKIVYRGDRKSADYILYHKNNLPLALIEAKDESHSVGDGMQQALAYAEALDIPFVYSSNGKDFLEHDRLAKKGKKEQELSLEAFPNPEALYSRYCKAKGIGENEELIIKQDYFQDPSGKEPRYFQQVAINRAVEAVAKDQKRLLLVMATGTGKTYTAFQIIWRLWKAKKKKRILFLIDRNILADQAIINDFKHFGGKMTKIEHHNVDKAYEIYLALYQGITGIEEQQNIFKQFSPDFFDLIIVDECHRGSANQNAAWHDILEYYSSATQIGLTATPKETTDISTQRYFGEPIYTYSLRQGIDDGFLAPYKVIRVMLDRDVEGYRPELGKLDKHGNEIPDRIYSGSDLERTLVIDERTQLVAKKIMEFMRATDPYQKAIIFCVDIDHAERMRQALVNEAADLVSENRRYIIRITGDNEEGKKELDHFIDPESRYPVIATTSKLLTTGVDAQTCKLIVLDQSINSMTEFKQIIGRGTRVREDLGKMYFAIMDFRGVTELFADPAFDGDPVVVYRAKQEDPIIPPEISEEEYAQVVKDAPLEGAPSYGIDISIQEEQAETTRKYYVNGVPVSVISERVQYLDDKGKLITESLRDYTKKNLLKEYSSLNDFLSAWAKADQKTAIIQELEDRGVFLDALAEEVNRDLDAFDLICHVAFGKEPVTRQQRAVRAKKSKYFAKYEGKAKEVVDALFEKYADQGIAAIDDIGDLTVSPFSEIGTPYEIVEEIFGGREHYLQALSKVQEALYSE
ncbi:MAG: DEAD/DEAH box helicase family protein [Candidatus Wildermuthbacteria bacterium]|nr:DEAD/DEAH box helicase family protein [Candidatus Wildermuthbacteria bacterium]